VNSLLEADDDAARKHAPDALRRRRSAAHRLQPLAHNGVVDPWAPGASRKPSTYGLSLEEIRSHANALVAAGWSLDEVRQRLAVQPRRTCSCQCGQ